MRGTAFAIAKAAFVDDARDEALIDHRGARLAHALQAMAAELASVRRECRESEQRVAQLRASHDALTVELAESRARLVDTADAERRRLERDLHDGVQQDLIAIRVRLEDAVEAIKADPADGERMLMLISAQLDDALGSLRSFARGIYPALLQDRGVPDALRSAALRLPIPVSVVDRGAGRCVERVEVAVYFCCLEALQNVTKHAGAGVTASVCFWHENDSLHFRVQDDGSGFDLRRTPAGSGLTNMRDRIAAVGGTLATTSRLGQGTIVRGCVPTAREARVARELSFTPCTSTAHADSEPDAPDPRACSDVSLRVDAYGVPRRGQRDTARGSALFGHRR